MAEVELLKAKYLGYSFDALDRFALCHGDFHPGGVMMCNGSVKVIDPEFTVFAPPGLDAGSQQPHPHPHPHPALPLPLPLTLTLIPNP